MTKCTRIAVWFLSVILTVSTAIHQRKTGPTYPVRGQYQIDGTVYPYRLIRSESGTKDLIVRIPAPPDIQAETCWRHYPTDRPWNHLPMRFEDGHILAAIPNQPPAGKVEYHVVIKTAGQEIVLPGADHTAIARFKGEVPSLILIPHILAMFIGMLLSNRIGIGILFKQNNLKKLTLMTFWFLFIGGIFFGCAVQYYAFGQPWTGFPIGTDLTDNKLAIAIMVWLVPMITYFRKKESKSWLLVASFVTLVIFLIPHSLLGSELKYD